MSDIEAIRQRLAQWHAIRITHCEPHRKTNGAQIVFNAAGVGVVLAESYELGVLIVTAARDIAALLEVIDSAESDAAERDAKGEE
jgi:hypothetical protein